MSPTGSGTLAGSKGIWTCNGVVDMDVAALVANEKVMARRALTIWTCDAVVDGCGAWRHWPRRRWRRAYCELVFVVLLCVCVVDARSSTTSTVVRVGNGSLEDSARS